MPRDASAVTPAPAPRPRPRPRRRPLVLGTAGVAATVVLGILLVASGNGPTMLDQGWHDLMLDGRTPQGVLLATWLDVVGGVGPMTVLGLVLTVALLIMRRPWSAVSLAAAMLCTELATATVKALVARPRPADSLADTGLASFPSGHTAIAAATGIMLALLIGRRFWLIAVAWIMTVAWSRTYLEAHWLTDVVAGAVLGMSIALIVWSGLCRLRSEAQARQRRGVR